MENPMKANEPNAQGKKCCDACKCDGCDGGTCSPKCECGCNCGCSCGCCQKK